jgi:transposase
MAMGTRKKRERQEALWYGGELPAAPGHPFYSRLNEVLEKAGFDHFCEENCADFYHARLGRPSLAPGLYFRIMMIGFFEGIDSERGIAWRLADSLTLRQFLSTGLDEATPDHVTISRTRRLIDGETHQRVFTWVLQRLAQDGLIKGKTIGVDSTTLEANAAMKSIVRRDTGESYTGYPYCTRSRGVVCCCAVSGDSVHTVFSLIILAVASSAQIVLGASKAQPPGPSCLTEYKVAANPSTS